MPYVGVGPYMVVTGREKDSKGRESCMAPRLDSSLAARLIASCTRRDASRIVSGSAPSGLLVLVLLVLVLLARWRLGRPHARPRCTCIPHSAHARVRSVHRRSGECHVALCGQSCPVPRGTV